MEGADNSDVHQSRFRCQGGSASCKKNKLVTGDAEYIPSELSELLARCVYSEIGLFSVPDVFVRAGVLPLSDDCLWQFFRRLDLYF